MKLWFAKTHKVENLFDIEGKKTLFDLSEGVITSDEPEPSWLEPQLELKDFQLSSAREFFPFSSKSKIGPKRENFIVVFNQDLKNSARFQLEN